MPRNGNGKRKANGKGRNGSKATPPPRKPRRRTKLTDKALVRLLGMMDAGSSLKAACARIGCSDEAIRLLRRDDPEFAEEYADAREYATRRVRSVMFKKAIGGAAWAVKLWLIGNDDVYREAFGAGAPLMPGTLRIVYDDGAEPPDAGATPPVKVRESPAGSK